MKTFVIHLQLSLHCVYNCIIIDSIFVFIQINLQEVQNQMLLSKQQLVVVKLGELRATRPTCSMVSRLDVSRSTPEHSPLAPPLPSPGPVSNGFLASSPSTPAIHPVYCCMSCTALEKRVEGLESSVGRLQAMVSMQHHNSPGTAQATSSATLASPSPGKTHSLDREIPSTPRSPASPASVKGYSEDDHLDTGPTVTPSTQPEPTVPFSMLFLLQDTVDLSYEQYISPMSTDAFNNYIKDPMWSSE